MINLKILRKTGVNVVIFGTKMETKLFYCSNIKMNQNMLNIGYTIKIKILCRNTFLDHPVMLKSISEIYLYVEYRSDFERSSYLNFCKSYGRLTHYCRTLYYLHRT